MARLCFFPRLFTSTGAHVFGAVVVAYCQFGWAANLYSVSLGPTLSDPSPEVEGERLIGELNCQACHAVDEAVARNLFSRKSPRLDQGGARWTPQFLRAFLHAPHRAKRGTTMPDLLHGLTEPERQESVEALTHYLMSSNQAEGAAPPAANAFKMREGRTLYHTVGCVACHAPEEPASAFHPGTSDRESGDKMAGAWLKESVPLGPLATKYTVETLTAFLLDPLVARPSGRMPSSNLSKTEASSIAMYLLRHQTNGPATLASQRVQGLAYEYFEGDVSGTAGLDDLNPVQTGMVENFDFSPKRRNQNIGFRFTGFIRIPTDGEYTFYTASDDGSRLFVDDRQVVENDGTHATTERSGRVGLRAGDHPIMVVWYNAGGPFELKVSWRGPGIPKQPIPASVLSYQGQPMVPLGQEPWVTDVGKAARGRELFSSLGCASCHSASNVQTARTLSAPSLLELRSNLDSGCLASEPGPRAPKFVLAEDQRAAMQSALKNAESWSRPLSASQRVHKTLQSLNCYACHARESIGGPSPERAAYFVTLGEEDLGDEGRLPPHLTGVGNKLRSDWLRKVLRDGESVRPYMATRMPRFGEGNVDHLVEAFAQADHREPTYKIEEIPLAHVKYGRALVGSGGFSCISCHTFANYKSLGIPAMDLTQMAKRLQHDWFHRYLLDPASLRPGTRMPSFWPEGKSLRDDVLEGDTHQQIDAIWAYLSKADDAGVPPGLIQGKMELVADTEASIYRAFIRDSGIRGIGVALPEKANYTFDATEMRPALIWQGPFIDAAKHRTGRGAGFEGPLGYNVVKMPPAPTLARLDAPTSAWPRLFGQEAGFKMKGYRLDEKRRPTFRYSFDGVDVEDTTIAVPGELEPSLVRTLKFKSDRTVNNLWHRAWVAGSIEQESGDTYLVDGTIRLKLLETGGGTPLLRSKAGQMELLVPVTFTNQKAQLSEEIIW